MKKLLMILIVLFFIMNLSGVENSDSKELMKRTILILPFFNQNDVEKYKYLSTTLLNALKTKLFKTEQYNFINDNLILNKLNKSGFTDKEIMELKNVKDLALQLKADVAVVGKYIIIDDNIMILINAIDIFTSNTVASTNVSGKVGIDIFRVIDQATEDIAGKILKKLKKIDRSYFDEMSKLIKKEHRLKKREQFPITRKVGIGLTVAGSTLILAGLPIIIYDLGVYYDVVKYYKEEYEIGNVEISGYKALVDIFTGLLVLGVSILSIGMIIDAVGIPLIIYKKKEKKISLDMGLYNNNIILSFAYKF